MGCEVCGEGKGRVQLAFMVLPGRNWAIVKGKGQNALPRVDLGINGIRWLGCEKHRTEGRTVSPKTLIGYP